METAVHRTTRSEVTEGLRRLGVKDGDRVFVQSDLGSLAPLAGKPSDVVLGGFLDAVGPTGTVIAPAFTKQFFVWSRHVPVFDKSTAPYTGALPSLMLRQPQSFRSSHPTHSVVAIGRDAQAITEAHTYASAAFEPVRWVIKARGMLLVMGCSDKNPGAASVHLAQHDLGLSQRHYLRLLLCTRHIEFGKPVRRILRESPGCSRGFGKAHAEYVRNEALRLGYIGPSWTVAVDAARAYEVDMKMLRRNPRALKCDDPACIGCAMSSGYNKRAVLPALLTRAARALPFSLGRGGVAPANVVRVDRSNEDRTRAG